MKKKTTWQRCLSYLNRYRGYFALSLLSALCSVIASLLGPMYIGHAVDAMIGPGNVDFSGVQEILKSLIAVYVLSSFFFLDAYLFYK